MTQAKMKEEFTTAKEFLPEPPKTIAKVVRKARAIPSRCPG